jgi:hypothetical protein
MDRDMLTARFRPWGCRGRGGGDADQYLSEINVSLASENPVCTYLPLTLPSYLKLFRRGIVLGNFVSSCDGKNLVFRLRREETVFSPAQSCFRRGETALRTRTGTSAGRKDRGPALGARTGDQRWSTVARIGATVARIGDQRWSTVARTGDQRLITRLEEWCARRGSASMFLPLTRRRREAILRPA